MDILKEIKLHVEKNDKVVIAIDGPSASGKTTFGNFLRKELDALLFHADDYYVPKARKTVERMSESGGNVDYERLEREIMMNLNSETITSNHFNCSREVLETGVPQKNKKIVIVEGAYSMHKTLRKYYTLSIFITVDKQLQLERILKRNGEELLKQWIEEWIPLENFYFMEDDIKNCVDYVVDTNVLTALNK